MIGGEWVRSGIVLYRKPVRVLFITLHLKQTLKHKGVSLIVLYVTLRSELFANHVVHFLIGEKDSREHITYL